MEIPGKTKLKLFTTMVRSRAMEEILLKLYRDGKVPGTLHLGIGQEAVSVGVITALNDQDFVLATYRGHSHALAKGLTEKEIIGEVLGRAIGCSGGMGGSMHLTSPEKGLLLTTSMVSSSIPLAAGIGYALNYRHQNNIVAAFIGDGATNNGDFHEGLNLASIWKCPVLVVIENNQYAISFSIKRSARLERLSDRASSYGLFGQTIGGMNVFEVYQNAASLVERIRREKDPIVLETLTYRFGGHFAGDVLQPYRTKEEVEEWRRKDPISLAQDALIREGILTENEVTQLQSDARHEAEDAAKEAISSPFPTFDLMDNFVW